MTLAKFVEYIKIHITWKNKPDQSTPVDAAAMMKVESGIKANNEAIQELAAAVVSQIINDPNKIASMAALFSVNEAVAKLNIDLAAKVNTSDLLSSWVSDPDTVSKPIATLNGWSSTLQHAPEGLYQHWGILLTVWSAYSETGDTSKPRTQFVVYNSTVQVRYFSSDTKKWSSWGAS